MSASREAKLERYAELVRKWNPAINLIARATLPDLENRHIRDSLQLAQLVPPTRDDWIDIGSGGGLPGIVVAISRPEVTIRLIDSDNRKVAFLRNAIRELSLQNCSAESARIEDLRPAHAGIVSARALAPLDRLMPYLDRHLAKDGTAWLMKGRNWQVELDQAYKDWRFQVQAHPSSTQGEAAILQIWNIRHV